MTYKSIAGGEGCEPVVESSGTQVPEHASADDTGRSAEALGAQSSEKDFATAETSQTCSVTTATQDDKHGYARGCVDEPDGSVLPTALDSTITVGLPMVVYGTR